MAKCRVRLISAYSPASNGIAARRNMTAIDATGLFALEEVAKHLHATKRTLILCGAREQPAQMIHQGEFEEVVGRENICANVQEALGRAEAVFEKIEADAAIGAK